MKKINSLHIKNFKCFNDVTLDFKDDTGVFIFLGLMGSGKTNLINAVSWCLYGTQVFKKESTSLLNRYVKEKENKNAAIEVMMEVEMDGEVFKFHRRKYELDDIKNSTFKVYRVVNGSDKLVEDTELYKQKFMPESILSFFMLSGEDIKRFFEKGYEGRLKENICQAADIYVLERAIGHLAKVLPDLNRDAHKDFASEEALVQLVNDIKLSIENNKDEIKKLESEREERDKKMKLARADLDKYNTKKDLSNQIERLENQISKYDSMVKNLILEQKELVSEYLPFVLTYEYIGDYFEEIEKQEREKKIPPPIDPHTIDDIIKANTCICDRGLDEKSKKSLLELKEIANKAGSKKFIVDTRSLLRDVYSNVLSVTDKYVGYSKQIDDIQVEVKKLNDNLADNKLRLKSTPGVIGDVASTIYGLEQKIQMIDRQIGSLETSLREEEADLEQKDVELQKIKSTKSKQNKQIVMYDMASSSHAELAAIKDYIVDNARRNVSSFANKFFKEMMWDPTILEIKFTEDYKIKIVENIGGSPVEIELLDMDASTGQSTLIGYAVVKALTFFSGFEDTPVFIDAILSPFGGSDDKKESDSKRDTVKQFLAQLPAFMDKKQLFITSPYRPEIKDFIQNVMKFNNCYEITKQEGENYSSVRRINEF